MRPVGLLCTLISSSLFALQTQYISFEHPDKWVCENAEGTYICQSTEQLEKREALVMSIATWASEWDSLENYLNYLKTPKKIKDDQGFELTSTITYTHKRKINGVEWVDSLQFNAELPGFWTRYLATVQNKLAILVTYVVSEEHYKQMAPKFERMVASLKPNADFDINSAKKSDQVAQPGTQKLGKEFLEARLNVRKAVPRPSAPPAPTGGSGSNMKLLIFVAALAGFGWAVIRRRKKPPTKN